MYYTILMQQCSTNPVFIYTFDRFLRHSILISIFILLLLLFFILFFCFFYFYFFFWTACCIKTKPVLNCCANTLLFDERFAFLL
ncbi:hypothetical protein QTP88_012497 [Uroleucon formosanum]